MVKQLLKDEINDKNVKIQKYLPDCALATNN